VLCVQAYFIGTSEGTSDSILSYYCILLLYYTNYVIKYEWTVAVFFSN